MQYLKWDTYHWKVQLAYTSFCKSVYACFIVLHIHIRLEKVLNLSNFSRFNRVYSILFKQHDSTTVSIIHEIMRFVHNH